MGEEQAKRGSIYDASRATAKVGWKSFWRLDAAWAMIPLSILGLFVISLLLGTISCILRPEVTYEQFDTDTKPVDLIKALNQTTGLLQKDEVLLDHAADMTCTVYTQIADSIVKNGSAPTPDIIQPQEVLNRRGQARFDAMKKEYTAKHGDMLECFEDEDAPLREAVAALDAQLNASKMKLKSRKIATTLKFTDPYVQDSVKAFSSEGFYGTEPNASPISMLKGKDLAAKGIALRTEAIELHQVIQSQPGVAKLQQEALNAVKAKANQVANPDETAHYQEEGKDPKYKE
jgi:hypothetical protein